MTRRSKVRLVGAVAAALFSLVNLVSVGYHAARGELLWAGMHAGLGLLGAYAAWMLAARRDARRVWGRGEPEISASPGGLADRLTHLEQSVDAVAVEVERIGEGQRFMTRLFAQRGAPRAPSQTPSDPVGAEAREAAPHVRRD